MAELFMMDISNNRVTGEQPELVQGVVFEVGPYIQIYSQT